MGLTSRREKIVLFGDSLTQRAIEQGGWGESLNDHFTRRADVYVRGFGGYNTRWALKVMDDIFPEKFDRRLRKHHLTIIMFGTNDSAIEEKTSKFQTSAYVPLEEYEKNMEIIINRAKKCSKHVIVMAPPAMDEQGRLNYQVEMYGDKAFAR